MMSTNKAGGAAFLLQLEHRLRSLHDTGEILALSAHMLGQRLGAQQVACFDIAHRLHTPTLQHAWTEALASGVVGEYFLGDYAANLADDLAAGRPIAISDVASDPRTATPAAQATFARLAMRALLNVPIVKEGRLAALFVVHSRAPRLWHADEIDLAVQVAERVWSTILRAQAEEQLRVLNADMERQVAERTQEFGRTWQVSPDLLGVLNLDGYFERSNPAWQATLGWSEEEIRTTHFFKLIHPDDLEHTTAAWDAANQGQPALRFENRYLHKLGGSRWLSWVAVPEGDKVYCSARDISMEKKRDAELAARNNERERLWRSAQDLMVALDRDGCFVAVNPASSAILGWLPEEMLGRSLFDFVLDEDAAATREALQQARSSATPSLENRYRHRDGGYRWLSWVAAPEGDLIFATGRHVTLEKEAAMALRSLQESLRDSETALLHAQKMEALGKLAAGVAHDFNNVLQIISGNLQLLHISLGNDRPSARHIASASAAVERGAALATQLLASARVEPLPQRTKDTAVQLTGPVLGGNESILVVEDDVQVQTTVVAMLRGLGYFVLKAQDGQGALNIISSGMPIDLLLTDVIMPGPVPATDMARQARLLLPDLAVLFTSGSPHDAIAHGSLEAGVELLGKPYRREDLARRVRHVLATRQQVTALHHYRAQLAPQPGGM